MVSVEFIKKVLTDQMEDVNSLFKREKIIQREGIKEALQALKYPNILAVLGVRRCGKSVFTLLLSKALEEKTVYVNFDDERLLLKASELNDVLQAAYELYGTDIDIVILDEIQNVKGWELFVNRLRRSKKVIVTGSNSKLLSGELATHLTGRHISFTLYPFSFREFMEEEKFNTFSTKGITKIKTRLEKYMKGSGFPEYLKLGPGIVIKIYEDILLKDCLRRHEIRKEATFKELSLYLTSNFSNKFSYSKLAKTFNIEDVHTVKNYISYLEQAYLIVPLKKFSYKLKEQEKTPKKAYLIDQGLSNFLSFRTSRDTGRIMENIVFIELQRRKKPLTETYYWQDHQGREVDFVVKQGLKVKQLIQTTYASSRDEIETREIKSLLKASELLKCKNLQVITWDYENTEKIKGKTIKFVPLWKWLLQ